MLEQKGIYAVLKNNLSLLEGLQFTKVLRIYVPGTYTNIFFLIFRFMRYTDVCFFSLSGVSTTLYDTRYLVRVMYQMLMTPGTYRIAITLFVSGWWYA